MANADTVKAIEDNLTAILTAQGFKVENSSTDPDHDTTPLAVIRFEGEEFEYTHGEKPEYSDAIFTVLIRLSDKYPTTSRDAQVTQAQKVRGAVTVENLNVGNLAASKLVSRVEHDGYDIVREGQISQINYRLKVRYREA